MDGLSPLEALDGWLLDLQQWRKTERTRAQYRSVLRPFLLWCSAKRLVDLHSDQLRRYILTCLAHKHPETQMREVGCIKTFGR